MKPTLQSKRLKLPNTIEWNKVFSRESFTGLTGSMMSFIQESPEAARYFLFIVAGMVVAVIAFSGVYVKGLRTTQMSQHASELRVLSQQIAKNASEAAGGNEKAFENLGTATQAFDSNWKELKTERNVKEDSMQAVETDWVQVKDDAQTVLAGQDAVVNLHGLAQDLSERVPDLQAEYDSVVDELVKSGATAAQIAVAKQQSVLSERILRSVNKVLEGGTDAVTSADSFRSDSQQFGDVLKAMISGNADMGIQKVSDPQAVDALNEIAGIFDKSVSTSADKILATSPQLFKVRDASDHIFKESQDMLDATTKLAVEINGESGSLVLALLGIAALIVVVACVILLIRLGAQQDSVRAEAEKRSEMARAEQVDQENQRNQAAILRLLDELGDLADGDLTVQATVTEDFTGAIADSINYSIDQLRGLVATINQTAVQVSAAAQETQSTAMHLAEASEHQAQEIAGASAAVNEMAVSIDQVSANASESAAVAERSVAIAHKGAEVVQNTISGMDTIREQIQETSKRIKRLGESSQEIGDIVSLINDIADQTNILALNAAIQASMAGEAGRGFAVVADEVQRLAERSAAATKQIEQLVKTIQTDTNEAVISMEQTTSEVVRGARLAQDAGVALEEIETVSRNLADLIQNISNAARQQAASAGHISNTMNVIQEITSQTTAGTIATARSIGNLAEMANELRHSVAGFKLPEHV